MANNTAFLSRLASELGVRSVLDSPRDCKLLFLQRLVRLFAYGASTLVLTLFLSSLGVSEGRIGLFMTLTLLGDVGISFFLTLFADGLGRRRILMAGSALMAGSGVVFSMSSNYWVLVAASIFGVITPSGNEIGPFRAIEESTLAQLTPKDVRSDIFAWYTLVGTAGSAVGTLLCGWGIQFLQSYDAWTDTRAYRAVFAFYAAVGVLKFVLSCMLSDNVESEAQQASKARQREPEPEEASHALESNTRIEREGLLSRDDDNDNENNTTATGTKQTQAQPQRSAPKTSIWPQISPASLSILWKLCILFAIDSGASGLVPPSWVIFFFNTKFGLPAAALGTLFAGTSVVQAASHLAAAAVAKRIGLVRTMVFSHLPSAVCLALIPAPASVWGAMVFLVGRACTQSMDQAPRQAFLAAVVLPAERTAVMGVVNVVKTLAQSVGPAVTGWLAEGGRFWIAFVAAGGMKIAYDLMMLRLFLGKMGAES